MTLKKFEHELTFINAAFDTVANAIKSAKTFILGVLEIELD